MLMITLLYGMTNANADNRLIVSSVTIPQGGSAEVEISLENSDAFAAFQITLELPSGISLVSCSGGTRFDSKHSLEPSPIDDTSTLLTCYSNPAVDFKGNEGVLFTLCLSADSSIGVGTSFDAVLKDVKFSDKEEVTSYPESVSFTITIGEPADTHVILDETSATLPLAATDVDVRLNRTIKANVWSTICLPFSASGEQVKDAFDDDVELAAFTAWNSEKDEDDRIVCINVSFTNQAVSDGIKANTPLLIRTTKDITTSTFDGVTLEPEEEPYVRVGTKTAQRGWFYGTYVKRNIPEECVFLNGNQFWYSNGTTVTKGYRGYFEFHDVLDAYYDATDVKIQFFIDGTATDVSDVVRQSDKNGNTRMYNLAGQRISHPQRGVNIVNGRKVVKK